MKSNYSASVAVVDKDGVYRRDLVLTVVTVTLNCSGLASDVTGDPACFFGNIQWVNGLIASVEETEVLSQRMSQFRVKSFFARLGRKPINTEADIGTANTALTRIAVVYAAVPAALYSFNVAEKGVCGPISGGNLIDEMRQVAQAGEGTLFVNELGVLRADSWKDNTDSTDTVIPDEAVRSAKIARNDAFLPSRIRTRGCFFSQYDLVVSLNDDQSQQGPGTSGNSGTGATTKCIKTGVPIENVEVKFSKVKATAKDLKSAVFSVIGFVVEKFKELLDGAAKLDIVPGAGYLLKSADAPTAYEETIVDIRGHKRKPREEDADELKHRPGKDDATRDKAIGKMSEALIGKGGVMLPTFQLSKGPVGGGGTVNQSQHRSTVRLESEYSETQIEMVVTDPDLQTEFGIITEQIENRYVPSKETLFDISVRRFQEIKMERNSWEVETAYLPCIKLNDIVQFKTPLLQDGTQQTVIGLITALKVSYSPQPLATMSMVVESFEDIGATVYTSGNLILDPNMVGQDGGSEWSSAYSGPNAAAAVGGGFGFIAAGTTISTNNIASITLTQADMEVGASYTVYFTLAELSGSKDVTFTILTGGGPLTSTYSQAAYESATFTCGAASSTFTWDVDIGPADPATYWAIYNVALTKTVTR